MKKFVPLLFALCFLASCPLWAMNNNAEQQELARRQRQTETTASLVKIVAFVGASFVAHHYFDHFIASLQGWPQLLANVAWLGTATLTTSVTTFLAIKFALATFERNVPLTALLFCASGIFLPAALSWQKLFSSGVNPFDPEYLKLSTSMRAKYTMEVLGGFLLPTACSELLLAKLNPGFF